MEGWRYCEGDMSLFNAERFSVAGNSAGAKRNDLVVGSELNTEFRAGRGEDTIFDIILLPNESHQNECKGPI